MVDRDPRAARDLVFSLGVLYTLQIDAAAAARDSSAAVTAPAAKSAAHAAGVVHGELLTLAPFGTADGVEGPVGEAVAVHSQ